jgi:hypothetical protein
MTDDTSTNREEPYWVERMRAAGYTVRVGTGTDGLSFEPEVSFHPPPEERRKLAYRLREFLQDLWHRGAAFRYRVGRRSSNAPLP